MGPKHISFFIVATVWLAAPGEAMAQQPAVTGCYVRQFAAAELQKTPDLAIRRIEIQFLDDRSAKPPGAVMPKVAVVLAPREDDQAPSRATAANCRGRGLALSCVLDCDGNGDGEFKVEPAGKDRIRFLPTGAIAVDACLDGVPAVQLPDRPVHRGIVLQATPVANCSTGVSD